jgi:hypothetical protein
MALGPWHRGSFVHRLTWMDLEPIFIWQWIHPSTNPNVCHYSVHVDWYVIYFFTSRLLEIICSGQDMQPARNYLLWSRHASRVFTSAQLQNYLRIPSNQSMRHERCGTKINQCAVRILARNWKLLVHCEVWTTSLYTRQWERDWEANTF